MSFSRSTYPHKSRHPGLQDQAQIRGTAYPLPAQYHINRGKKNYQDIKVQELVIGGTGNDNVHADAFSIYEGDLLFTTPHDSMGNHVRNRNAPVQNGAIVFSSLHGMLKNDHRLHLIGIAALDTPVPMEDAPINPSTVTVIYGGTSNVVNRTQKIISQGDVIAWRFPKLTSNGYPEFTLRDEPVRFIPELWVVPNGNAMSTFENELKQGSIFSQLGLPSDDKHQDFYSAYKGLMTYTHSGKATPAEEIKEFKSKVGDKIIEELAKSLGLGSNALDDLKLDEYELFNKDIFGDTSASNDLFARSLVSRMQSRILAYIQTFRNERIIGKAITTAKPGQIFTLQISI